MCHVFVGDTSLGRVFASTIVGDDIQIGVVM